MSSSINPPLNQRGMSLIETMVAVLILAIGILGLLGFQAVAIANISAAKYRTDASFLASQLIGALWANRQSLEATPAAFTHFGAGGGCEPTGSRATHAAVTGWLTDVGAALPGATADAQQVRIDANQMVIVTVCWKAPGDTRWHNHIEVAQLVGSPIL